MSFSEMANDTEGITSLRQQLETGSIKCGQFLDPVSQKISLNPSSPNKKNILVKQKSLGRTLSTSVLRIKKKRSFWTNHALGSNEKFKQ